MMNHKWKRWLELAALFLFCAATFLIVGEHFIPGAICFGAAAVMLGASRKKRKNDRDAPQPEDETT